jgi:hypothetical protein
MHTVSVRYEYIPIHAMQSKRGRNLWSLRGPNADKYKQKQAKCIQYAALDDHRFSPCHESIRSVLACIGLYWMKNADIIHTNTNNLL